MDNKSKQSFTLIELLVVIAIVGILAGIIIVSMVSATDKARIAKGQTFSGSIKSSLVSSLVSEWSLDGNTNDLWGGNNGTIAGGASIVNSGCVHGSCLNFPSGTPDGSGLDYVTVPDSQSLDSIFGTENFTFDVWIYSKHKDNFQGIINKRANNGYTASPGGIFIDGDGDLLRLLIGTGNPNESFTSASYSIAALHDKWINVVGTAGDGKLNLYIDGVKIAGPVTITTNPPTNDEPLTIGAFYEGSRSFYGMIDNVRIYNKALSLSEIESNYYAGLSKMLAQKKINENEYWQRSYSLR